MFTVDQVINGYNSLSPSEKAEVLAVINSSTAPETGSFEVRISGYSRINLNKIHAIKSIRSVTGWGLKEAKCAIDNMPTLIPVTSRNDADFLMQAFKDSGFIAELLGA